MYGAYSFSEVPYSSAEINVSFAVDSLVATTAVGEETVVTGATLVTDSLVAVTSVGDVIIRISARLTTDSFLLTTSLGQVTVWSFVTGPDTPDYTSVLPNPDANYGNLVPSPGNTWNDLAT